MSPPDLSDIPSQKQLICSPQTDGTLILVITNKVV